MLTHREMWHTNFVECHANRANAKWNEESTHLSFKLISWKIIDWIIYSIHFHQVQVRQSYLLLFVPLCEFIQIFTLLYRTVEIRILTQKYENDIFIFWKHHSDLKWFGFPSQMFENLNLLSGSKRIALYHFNGLHSCKNRYTDNNCEKQKINHLNREYSLFQSLTIPGYLWNKSFWVQNYRK